jgi:hypothetical protein
VISATGSMLALAPGTCTAPGTGANTDHLVFFVGTHHPGWLGTASMPLFVSDRRLRGYKTLPRATSTWALDSGGFTELSRYGTWGHGPAPGQYAARIRRYRDEIGHLAWAAPQDWMCEPAITARTGLTVAGHQQRTIDSVLRLRDLDPGLSVIPVLQGWTRCGILLASADSLAWSYAARRQPPLPGCELRHINCANCPRYAARWYAHVRAQLRSHAYTQPALFDLPGGDT